jgi:hypothetical protein
VEVLDDEQVAEANVSYWMAWHSLTTDRPMGAMGGAGRIPWSVIDRYAERNLFEDSDHLARMLWAMDGVYLEWMADEAKAKTAAKAEP